ncbi:Flp family type IVb pilin [Nocardioides sp.]|uniref:Flp family type IVb pilin n=1 Tax=Nocardioides sp. TaxID=35761 RepID=UPI000D3138F6|nr:Flp family type IVb pilin [Nocardioides sp.]HSX66648.1 Flp family type IVb pilin [Nocardioides sp.]
MTEYFVRLVNFMTMPREEEKGATAVEYGLLVALIAAIIIGVVTLLGQNIMGAFTDVNTQM